MKKFFTIIFILIYYLGSSQIYQGTQNVFPYAPETSSLLKYQETPVSNYTGIPNISIPIYVAKSGSVEVPITLTYHAGGVLVSDIASSVGLGWSISTVAPITRKINGYTDENGVMKHDDNIESFLNSGIDEKELRLISAKYTLHNIATSDLMSDEFSLSLNEFSGSFFYNPKNKKIVTYPMSDIKIDYYTKVFDNYLSRIDTVNVTTTSGLKYTFGGDGKEILGGNGSMSSSNIYGVNAWKIKKIKGLDNNEINFSYILNHMFRTELAPQTKEIQYFVTSYTTGCNNPLPAPAPPPVSPEFDVTYSIQEALLDKIETNDALITFIYSNRLDFNNLKKLDKIIIKDKAGSIISEKRFNYGYFENTIEASGANDPSEDPTKRLKLISYQECGRDNKCITTSFEYYEDYQMKQRLSFSTDHWGYYNGANNNNAFPNVPVLYFDTFLNKAVWGFTENAPGAGSMYGIANKGVNHLLINTNSLKSVTYPEGGKNEFIYEPNTASTLLYEPKNEHYFLAKKKTLQKNDFFFVSATAMGETLTHSIAPTESDSYYKTFVKEIDLAGDKALTLKMTLSSTFRASTFSNSLNDNYLNAEYSIFYYENGVKKYLVNSGSLSGPNEFTLKYSHLNSPAASLQKVYLEIKHIYWGGLNSTSNLSNYIYAYSQIALNWEEQDPDYIEPVIPAGGIRIKEIKRYDNTGQYKYSSKYSYIKNGNSQLSSGVLFDIPMYTRNIRNGYVRSYKCPSSFGSGESGNRKVIEDLTELSMRPVIAGMRTQGRTIGYTNVEVIKTDNSNNIKGKEIFEYYVEPPLQTGDNFLATTEATSARYEFMEARDWRNGELLKYTALNNTNDTIRTTKREFYLLGAPNISTTYYSERNVKMLFANLISPIDYLPGGKTLRNIYGGAILMSPDVEARGIFPNYIGMNSTFSPGPFPVFIKHNDAFLLQKEIATDYFGSKKRSRATEYFYNDSAYPIRLTSKKESFIGENVDQNISYKYANQTGNQLLIAKNMTGIPLETTTTQTKDGVTKTLGRSETLYPTALPTAQAGTLVLPLSSVSYDVLNNAPSTEVSYDKYDDKGNLLQYTGKDGIPVAIVWGYNKTQPIARVEGMAYDQLISAVSVSGIVTASDNDAADPTKEGLLLDALNSFRKEQALSGKLISTYTYDPLIGVTSITPPSGVRQVYTYDAAGRLKEGKVRGKNSSGNYTDKKVSENNYNYKP
ncbi:hypothetical protein [Chryseobacterium hagamense]|uniref:YD repeat-containing protein n=1 Tax=Chryseobacterium hagamense TaxID=395935 RepID=A0A511YP08_9FLAO|nr:hypothetical protein [Chryseobacterium hagamense]GEN76927.1 hypothetical protein CHA01nite_26670 [Chryseobacterium hagamense]